MSNQVVEFWSGKTLAAAKELILAGNVSDEQWKSDTDVVMPRLLTPIVLANLPGKDVCVEIGAGVGRIIEPMMKHFDAAIGVDISPAMVLYSKGYIKSTAAMVLVTDGSKIPVASDSVDFVYSYICFQHLQSHDEVRNYLKESRRILKDGGVIRVQTHCGIANTKFQGFHGCFYESLGAFVTEFMAEGFLVLESERGISHPDSLWVTAQKVG